MRTKFLPKNRLGRFGVWLGIVLVLLMVLEIIFAISIQGDSTIIESSPVLTILANILSIAVSLIGPLSFIIGIITVIRHKDWLVFKSLAILYFFTILLFLLGEFLFAH
jgi:uncharacterized membrane protein YhaH (DUF805 family)